MRYLALSIATLGVIFALAAAAFGVISRSLIEISPERKRAWATEWNESGHRLLVAAAVLVIVALLLFLLSYLG